MRLENGLTVAITINERLMIIHRLQLINTSTNTFFSKLCAFLAEQRRRRKARDG